MKKTKLFIIILVLIVMLFPWRFNLKDGGSVVYQSLFYQVTKYHSINYPSAENPYIEGLEVKILGITVYRQTNE